MTTATLLEAERGLTIAQVNAIQARLEEKAREEAKRGADIFRDWCADLDPGDLIDIIVHCIDATNESISVAERMANALAGDYVEHRVNTATIHERAEIQDEIAEEERE